MTKEEIISHIKYGKISSIFREIGKSTNYFDYNELSDIMENLDTETEMNTFAQVAADEYDLYCNSPKLQDLIIDGYSSFKYENIRYSLKEIKDTVLRIKALEAKYADDSQSYTAEYLTEHIHTPQEWTEAGLNVSQTLLACTKQMKDTFVLLQNLSQEGQNQLKALKNGSLTTLRNQYQEISTKYNQLLEEKTKLDSWYADWQALRDMVKRECYDSNDVNECGGLDDPSLMLDTVQAILENRVIEKQLRKENEELRKRQEAWRESPEYKVEISELNASSISIEQIKSGLFAQAKTFSDKDAYFNFLLRFSQTLSQTVWQRVATEVLDEALSYFKNPEQILINQLNVGNGLQLVDKLKK